ncbi:hypothetical protein SDC9_02337 [bioreactor metagenome]|uniref:TonB C-terminal domain-containing protein n=1 Tax=bioreactor metagenome TaxID=1076179 RepID=A0A644SQD9_9ZZZZ
MNKMLTRITLLFSFIAISLQAQIDVYDKYPIGQDFYKGGLSDFYKDIRKVIKKKNLKPCENENEKYLVNLVIYADKKVSLVKDFDTLNIQKNKCAFDFSKSVLPYLDNWQPAKLDGKEVNAIAQFMIDPYFLFYHKFKNPNPDVEKPPVFEKNIKLFQKEVRRIIESYIKENISGRKISLSFTITELGALEDLRITNLQLEEIDKEEIIKEILRIKGKWKPGTRNGKPVKFRMNLTFEQEFNLELENKVYEDLKKGNYSF